MIEHKPLSIVLAALLFLLVGLIMYYPGFDAPMYYDSAVRLQGNEYLFCRGLRDVASIFPQRPLSMATFYLNYVVAGMSPFYFRLCNVVLVALTAMSAMILAFLILDIVGSAAKAEARWRRIAAFLLGLVFVVHPIQTYLVVYIWQRMALLTCLFYFSALAAYLATRTGRMENRFLGYSIFSLLSVCTLASKESAITLPVVLVLAEVILLRSNWRSLIKPVAIGSAAMLVFLGALSFLERAHGVGEASGFFKTIARYYRESGLTFKEVALSQCRVMFSYIEMIVLPLPRNIRLFDAWTISRSIMQPPATLAAVAGIVAFLGTSFYLLRKRPVAGFGLLFFLVNLFPEAFLVPQYLFFGYRPALSMFGLLLAMGDLLLLLLYKVRDIRGFQWLPAGIVLSLCIGILGLCFVARAKAGTWKDPVAFWAEVVAGFPSHAKNIEKQVRIQSLTTLGAWLESRGRHDEAIGLLKRALAINPKNQDALGVLGKAYVSIDKVSEAKSCYEQALALDSTFAEAFVGLGEISLREVGYAAAREYFQKALDAAKDNPTHAETIGNALMRSGNPAAAVHYFRRSVALYPCSAQNQYALAKAFMAAGDITNALISLRKTVETKPDHWKAHNDLGVIFAKRGDLDKAVAHFEAAVRINPEDVPSRKNLETALRKRGQRKGP
jgi:Flp pilus assembly protein TadD